MGQRIESRGDVLRRGADCSTNENVQLFENQVAARGEHLSVHVLLIRLVEKEELTSKVVPFFAQSNPEEG